jgi:hypothetical protein
MQKQSLVNIIFFTTSTQLEQHPHGVQNVVWDLALEAMRELRHRLLGDFFAVLDNAEASADHSFNGLGNWRRLSPVPEPSTGLAKGEGHGAGDSHPGQRLPATSGQQRRRRERR